MTEFLVAAAIGVILPPRVKAFFWPVAGLIVMAIAAAAYAWSPLAMMMGAFLAFLGFNAGLIAGLGLLMLLNRPFRSAAARPIVKRGSGLQLPH